MYNILRDFVIQTDPIILDRKPENVLINEDKRTCQLVNFTVLENNCLKIKERQRIEKYLNLAGN